MKQNFDTRLRTGLFPEMPQSFADGLLRAAETAGGTQNRSAQTDAAKSSATGSEPKKRRFPVGKILAGAAAALLVAASIVIAVFAPGIGRNKHGAVDPAVNPLLGRWTLTEVEQNGETVDPETIGLQMQLQFSDESVTVSAQTGGAEGQNVYRYAFADNAVELTAEGARIPVLPASGVYDPETNTLRFANEDGDGALIFSRVLNKQTLLGVWKLTRSEHAVDPSPFEGSTYEPWEYEAWEKEQTWEEDAKPQPWYLEFTADGRMYYFLYAPDGGVQLNQSGSYTISDNHILWSNLGMPMRYEAETDTICWIFPVDRREYYERVPDAVIDDPYRQKLSDLRKQYPEYFGIDTFQKNLLKVYVWQINPASYSCALVSGREVRSEAEIGMMRGVTIEEMRMILSTYYEARDCNIEPENVEVVPFHNPVSSYWYEIDEAYTGRVRWLLTGIPYECDDPLYSTPLESKVIIDNGTLTFDVSTVCDVDGDGRLETCMLTYGPTSGLFTFTLSVYRNGTAVYRNTFQTAYGYFRFQRMTDGLNLYYYDADSIKTTGRSTAAYAVTIEDGVLVLTDEQTGETVEYWGELDPQWNIAVVKTPEERLEGLWCAMRTEEGQDGLLEIGFYKDAATGKRMVFYREGDFRYDGYSYTVEEGERNDWKTDDPWYRFTFTDGDEEQLLDLVLDGKEPVYMERNVGKGKGGWKTYYKCPIIEAEELPMKQVDDPDKYIFAGEGKVHYLDIVDLNGDGKPVRVSVYGYTPVSVVTGEEGESELTVQIGACEWKINEKLVMDSGIYIDLDPNDGHGNLLLSTTRADGTERTYELHVENGELVCGHTVEGYCFLNDSEQQELMLATPSDLLGAKYGYREVKGEALEPVDEWLQASALIERVMFGKREDNIKDGMLLHLVRALPCEIDGVSGTLEPDVYIYLCQWNDALTEIIFSTEDDRWITVHPDAGLMLNGVSLYDYFDNAPKG